MGRNEILAAIKAYSNPYSDVFFSYAWKDKGSDLEFILDFATFVINSVYGGHVVYDKVSLSIHAEEQKANDWMDRVHWGQHGYKRAFVICTDSYLKCANDEYSDGSGLGVRRELAHLNKHNYYENVTIINLSSLSDSNVKDILFPPEVINYDSESSANHFTWGQRMIRKNVAIYSGDYQGFYDAIVDMYKSEAIEGTYEWDNRLELDNKLMPKIPGVKLHKFNGRPNLGP